MWLNILLALGSGIVGAVVTPLLAQTRDGAWHVPRYAPHSTNRAEPGYPASFEAYQHGWPNHEMEEKLSKVESLAMIARVPRKLVDRYAVAHRQAYNHACEAPYGGSETSDSGKAEIGAATAALVAYLWHPAKSRLKVRLRGRAATEATDATAPRAS